MTELSRSSALASRHTALGSGLEDWNDMGTAWSYSTDPNDEHDAIREAAGLFDMSPLRKVFVRGADAMAVLDHATSRDLGRVGPGQAAYLSVLTEEGTLGDDAIVSNNGGDEWMIVHGTGQTLSLVQESAKGRNADVEFDDTLHDLSFQGPKSLGFLNARVGADLSALKYFHHVETELFGHAIRLSRTGYSGERGYEIFADGEAICDIWDGILAEGAADGIMPCSFTALDKVRIEAGLLFYDYDMNSAHTPWEVGLGFTVSRTKSDFRGKTALFAAEGKEKIKNIGLIVDHADALAGGEALSLDGKEVGVVNSPGYSHRMGRSLALAHVSPDAAATGTVLHVSGDGMDTTATIADLPFHDPTKSKTHG